ncbi:Hypothetical protein, putative [Bodo saltans]|uniref:Uncharacterized protein n=1 Tax=Bodo saltans TaxID=75058 RepID=A0A0S4KKF5_BODSA|nr:Hypothetical protein, putative [Bodo saltans]|eukprot:CUI15074.1 Hypothetical protein, putative [Bodo saltans]
MNSSATEDLRALVETVEMLQSSERKLKAKLSVFDQQLLTKEAEIESLRMLPNENILLREENHQLRERIRELEQTTSRAVELGSLGSESQTQLQVKLQAFQRHNHYLQGELALKESKIRTLQEKVDIVSEEIHQKDRRCSLLVEKLRQHSIDPSSATSITGSAILGHSNQIQVPEEMYAQMKQKVSNQTSAMELLQERVETLQEDHQRRELLVEALHRENAALRQSVSRLIAQVNGTASMALAAAAAGNQFSDHAALMASPGGAEKLRAYRTAKSGGGGLQRRAPSPPVE